MTKFYLQNFVVTSKKGLYKKLLFCVLLLIHTFVLANDKQAIKDFLEQTFSNPTPIPQRVWINNEKQAEIKTRFNPSHPKLSYRYWKHNDLTVWILDEIGKEQNITTGIVIENGKIKKVEVLVYRESRGGQVQNQRFTNQYNQKDKHSNLIKEIDSISGATLSVTAINKQVKLALWLNSIK